MLEEQFQMEKIEEHTAAVRLRPMAAAEMASGGGRRRPGSPVTPRRNENRQSTSEEEREGANGQGPFRHFESGCVWAGSAQLGWSDFFSLSVFLFENRIRCF